MLRYVLNAGVVLGALALTEAPNPASALTMKECGVKYKAAESAGSLNGMKWNDFRKAQCGTDTSAGAPASTISAAAAAKAGATPATATTKPAPSIAKTPVPGASGGTAAKSGAPVFPSEVAAKYNTESPGKARMHTCLDQYNANKASSTNGGLNWIAKGGGYYS